MFDRIHLSGPLLSCKERKDTRACTKIHNHISLFDVATYALVVGIHSYLVEHHRFMKKQAAQGFFVGYVVQETLEHFV